MQTIEFLNIQMSFLSELSFTVATAEASGPVPLAQHVVVQEDGKSRSYQRRMEHLLRFPGVQRIAVVPLVGKLDEGTGRGRRLQNMECVEQDPGLPLRVTRLACLVTEGKVHEDGARRFDGGGDIEGSRKHEGWNAGFLDRASEQSHGLVAQLSDRDQEGRINAHLPQAPDQMRRHLFLESGPCEDSAHEGEGR